MMAHPVWARFSLFFPQRRKVDSLHVVVHFRFAEPLPPGSAEPQLGMERSGSKLGYSIAIA